MKKSINMALCVTTAFYFAVALLGYAAFGDKAPTNLLIVQHVGSSRTGFTNPYWLVDCANVFVMVNMLGCYQVISAGVSVAYVSAHRACIVPPLQECDDWLSVLCLTQCWLGSSACWGHMHVGIICRVGVICMLGSYAC